MRHLITLVEDLQNQGIGFRSVSEGAIDTTCASGELIFNIFSALAQFERRLIPERTKAGLAAARPRPLGRPSENESPRRQSQIGENSVGGQIPGGGRYLRNAENLAFHAVSLRESVKNDQSEILTRLTGNVRIRWVFRAAQKTVK